MLLSPAPARLLLPPPPPTPHYVGAHPQVHKFYVLSSAAVRVWLWLRPGTGEWDMLRVYATGQMVYEKDLSLPVVREEHADWMGGQIRRSSAAEFELRQQQWMRWQWYQQWQRRQPQTKLVA